MKTHNAANSILTENDFDNIINGLFYIIVNKELSKYMDDYQKKDLTKC